MSSAEALCAALLLGFAFIAVPAKGAERASGSRHGGLSSPAPLIPGAAPPTEQELLRKLDNRDRAASRLAEPPSYSQLLDIPIVSENDLKKPELGKASREAMRESALGYGARAGLSRRTWETSAYLEGRASYLDRVWNFGALMIPIRGGAAVVVPPVIEVGGESVAVDEGGQSANVVQRSARILQDARVVGITPTWRGYLSRSWNPDPGLPDPILLPRNEEEKRTWIEHMRQGWGLGIEQADAIYEADLAAMNRDFRGMVLYRELVASGLIKELYLAEADLGVTGGGPEMKIGERTVRITTPASLSADMTKWRAYALRN
jgi:defect in organelle trafficking protein DotC